MVLEYNRSTGMLQQAGRRSAGLEYRSLRAQVALEDDRATLGLQGLLPRQNHFPVVALGIGDILLDGSPGDGQGLAMKLVKQVAHHNGDAAGIEHILHEVLTRRLNVRNDRCLAGDFVKPLQRKVDSQPTCEGSQVDDRVGRAADGHVHAHSVLQCVARQNLCGREVLLHHLDDALAATMGDFEASGIGGRNVRATSQGHAEGFGQTGHRRCRAHDHAVPC